MIIDFDGLIRKLNSAGGRIRIPSGVLKENIIVCLEDTMAAAFNRRGELALSLRELRLVMDEQDSDEVLRMVAAVRRLSPEIKITGPRKPWDSRPVIRVETPSASEAPPPPSEEPVPEQLSFF